MGKFFRNTVLLSIVLISFLMHFEHFPKELMSIHVWRQTQTQSTINNFYEEDMNILNPRRNDRGDGDGIFRMEFPLMQWLVAATYHLFGKHLIVTRIIMFIIGLFSVFGIYKLLLYLFRIETLAIIGAWTFNFSPAFYYYTINPLPDNLALCCSIWGLAFFFKYVSDQRLLSIILSGIFLSLGTLCKLPFIVYYIVPIVYFVYFIIKKGFEKKLFIRTIAMFSWSIAPIAWYLTVIPQWHGNVIVKGMLKNEDSFGKIFDSLWFNFSSTLPELLLNYGSTLLFVAGFYFLFKRKAYKNVRFLMLLGLSIMVLVYFFFEINAIAKVHDYYLFPFYPLLFSLVAYGAYHLLQLKKLFFRYLTWVLLIILPFACYLRMEVRWNPDSPGLNKDLLVYKNDIRDAVPDDALVVAGNDKSHYIFFYYIDKKGWGFQDDNLSANELADNIRKGAQYLYIDSRKIDNNPTIQPFLEKLIIEKGSIRIYKLKKAG